jgi:hypothetical protein
MFTTTCCSEVTAQTLASAWTMFTECLGYKFLIFAVSLSFQVLVEKMGLPEGFDAGSSLGHGDPLRMCLIFE